MTDDAYKPPEASLVEGVDVSYRLASRWARLAASLIDTIIILLAMLPVVLFTGGFESTLIDDKGVLLDELVLLAISLVTFALVNGSLLKTSGQTVGKKLLGIKIVTLDDQLPTIQGNFLKRYAMYFLPGQLPGIGSIISLVNILMIFGEERRCLHDRVADTKVVVAE